MSRVFQAHVFNPMIVKVKTATYQVLVGDDEVQVTPAALSTVTLPALSALRASLIEVKAIRVKKMDTGVQQVVVTASGSDLLGGSDQDITLSNYLDEVVLESDPIAKDWRIAYRNLDVDGEKFTSVHSGIGTQNTVAIWTRQLGASGISRGLLVQTEYAGTNVGVTLNTYSIRGYAKVTGTIAGSNTAYVTGVQGRLEIASGGTMTGGKACGILAQMGAQAGTISGGTMYGLWIDTMQMLTKPSAAGVYALGMEAYDGATTLDAFVWAYGKATYLLKIGGNNGSFVIATNPSTAAGCLKIDVEGTAKYIPLYSSPTGG